MSQPFFSPAAMWNAPGALASRVREAARTGRWDAVSVDAVAGISLMRDVAIAELLSYAETDSFAEMIAAGRAEELYTRHPCEFTASVAAAVTAPMDSRGNYALAAMAAGDDLLARHIDEVRDVSLRERTRVPVGELTMTTGLHFSLEHAETEAQKYFWAAGFEENWNGFAAPLVDRVTLEAFMRATDQALEPRDGSQLAPTYETYSRIDLAPGTRPGPEDRDVLEPNERGLYSLSGYTVHRVADTVTNVSELWRVVDNAVVRADRDHQRAAVAHANLAPSWGAAGDHGLSL